VHPVYAAHQFFGKFYRFPKRQFTDGRRPTFQCSQLSGEKDSGNHISPFKRNRCSLLDGLLLLWSLPARVDGDRRCSYQLVFPQCFDNCADDGEEMMLNGRKGDGVEVGRVAEAKESLTDCESLLVTTVIFVGFTPQIMDFVVCRHPCF
jgi:hypothetical protein